MYVLFRVTRSPLDDAYLYNAIRYVEQNPVKANMVKNAWEYRYSSARYRMNLIQEDKLLDTLEIIDGIKDYKSFLLKTHDYKFIRDKTHSGKPCGDENFYERIKQITGIDYKNKKVGRKKLNE